MRTRPPPRPRAGSRTLVIKLLTNPVLHLAENFKPLIHFDARFEKKLPLHSLSSLRSLFPPLSLVLGGIMKPSSSSRKSSKNGPSDVPHVFLGGSRVNQTALGVHYGRRATARPARSTLDGHSHFEPLLGFKRDSLATWRDSSTTFICISQIPVRARNLSAKLPGNSHLPQNCTICIWCPREGTQKLHTTR